MNQRTFERCFRHPETACFSRVTIDGDLSLTPARDFPRGGAADATAATRGILERLVEERSRVPEREGR
jgi:hypothetical protein